MAKDESGRRLETYLQDHYAAGIGALELLEHLQKAHAGERLEGFFQELHRDINHDHEQLHNLMSVLGCDHSTVRDAGAWTAGKLSLLKLGLSGDGTNLRLLQSLESLYVGITGKRLLWRSLEVVQESWPVLRKTSLAKLEERACDQAERVETERIKAAAAALVAGLGL